MSFTFKHPKYYTELRKRNRDLSELQRVKPERSVPQSDQVISRGDSTEAGRRSPGPGLTETQASSGKRQAPSRKHQAPSRKRQAP